jgi:uncharacterized membrane protein
MFRKLSPKRAEMLIRVVIWRIISMATMFTISAIFTGNPGVAFMMALVNGLQQFIFQWLFEIAWFKYMRKRVKNAFTRK